MSDTPRRRVGRRAFVNALGHAWWLTTCGLAPRLALGQARPPAASAAREHGVELSTLALRMEDGALMVDFSARLTLSRSVEDALQRGVPVYFVAEATLYRARWYWRDERIARVRRVWRVAFQPLTATWRVGLAGINQSHASLAEALAAISTASRWKLADAEQVEAGARHYLAFVYELDAGRLPSPMQIGIDRQPEWNLRAERVLHVEG